MDITVSGILSYPSLFKAVTAEGFPDGPPKFRCSVLLKKGSEDHLKIEKAIEKLKRGRWGDNIPSKFDLKCLIDLSHIPETKNYMSLKALNDASTRPRVIDGNGEEIISPDMCVPGLKCKMCVSLYTYDKAGGGISAGIHGVKILDVMGELGRLGRALLTDDEMFGEQVNKAPQPPLVEQFIMTEKAIELDWFKRSDVTGEWNDDELLLEYGYMTKAKQNDFR